MVDGLELLTLLKKRGAEVINVVSQGMLDALLYHIVFLVYVTREGGGRQYSRAMFLRELE